MLYTGVTNDLERRLFEHESASPTSFTGKYTCGYLPYCQFFQFLDDAIAREKQIKGWNRKKKMELIDSFNLNWLFLNNRISEP